MDEDSTSSGEGILHETKHRGEVLLEVRRGRVELGNPLVGELLGELGVEARADREDMRDAVAIKDVLIR